MQQWLRWIFTEPKGVHATLDLPSQETRRPEPQPRFLEWIENAPPLDPQRRLDVYAGAYFSRLLEAMENDFPAIRRALGTPSFRVLVADYLMGHPSTSANIEDLGGELPTFLKTHPLTQQFGFLPDLALLEWDFLASIYTTRLPPLDLAVLNKVPQEAWPQAKLILDPTVRLIKTDWAVDSLWHKRHLPKSKKSRLLLRPKKRWLLLYRNEVSVQLQNLSPFQWKTLQYFQQGLNLELACAELEKKVRNQKTLPAIQYWLEEWFMSGVIKKIELAATR